MQKYFQMNFKGEHFHLFSPAHLITLFIIVSLGVLLIIFRRFLRQPGWNKGLCYLLVFLLLASEISVQLWYIDFKAWSLRYSLPLELSDLGVILSVVMLLTGNVNLFKFTYFVGLGGSIQAMLTPDLGIYSFPHFRFIEFFTAHGSVFLACLFMAVVDKYRPTIRSLWVTFLILDVYGACVFFLNRLISANYLYIMKKPSMPSLMDVLGPWPWYILSLAVVVIIVFYILYSPFWLSRKIHKTALEK